MLEKFLVPIDSIEWDNTLNAVKSAIELSRGCSIDGEPELIFVHVIHIKPRIPMSEGDRLTEMKKEEIKEEFEEIRNMCEQEGLRNIRTLQKEGDPKKEIVKLAKEEEVDMIIMGSGKLHDRSAGGRIHKFFYGSVTEEVIHAAPCSVFVARP